MHWELSDEQELFATSLREWLSAKFPTESVREMLAAEPTGAFTAALIDAGWWGVGYPEDDGGQGGGMLEIALAAREFGRAAVPNGQWTAGVVVGGLLTSAERAQWLTGEHLYAPALRCDRVPEFSPSAFDGRSVSGRVSHVLAAAQADVLLVPAIGADGPVLARIAVEHARLTPDDLLDRSRTSATVAFDAAPVLDARPIEDGAMEHASAVAAVLSAADALGVGERMLDLAVEYSKQRKQFGRFIGSFQAVKHAAAQMLVTVEAAYSSVLYAAAALDAGLADATTVAAVAKAQATKSIAELADSALTVHGAIGYTWEHDLHLFYKRAKLDRALFGAPSAWNERIARAVLDQAV